MTQEKTVRELIADECTRYANAWEQAHIRGKYYQVLFGLHEDTLDEDELFTFTWKIDVFLTECMNEIYAAYDERDFARDRTKWLRSVLRRKRNNKLLFIYMQGQPQ